MSSLAIPNLVVAAFFETKNAWALGAEISLHVSKEVSEKPPKPKCANRAVLSCNITLFLLEVLICEKVIIFVTPKTYRKVMLYFVHLVRMIYLFSILRTYLADTWSAIIFLVLFAKQAVLNHAPMTNGL